jgi:chromate transporter
VTYWKNIRELSGFFLSMGIMAFGGPAAHIALMQRELVERKKWIDQAEFLSLIGITNLVPGPNSTEMVMHMGYKRGKSLGLILGGLLFIIPGVVLSTLIAILVESQIDATQFQPVLITIQCAVIAIVSFAAFKLTKKAAKKSIDYLPIILALGLSFAGISSVYTLLITAGLFFVIHYAKSKQSLPLLAIVLAPKTLGFSSSFVFLQFLKIGSILYGSGYVLFAYLDDAFVKNGLLSNADLMNAIAVGQLTPGPILSTAAYVGFQMDGFSGAFLASLGIFLPSFILVFILSALVPKMLTNPHIKSFTHYLSLASVGLLIYVGFHLIYTVAQDWWTISCMIILTTISFVFQKLSTYYIILLGIVLGVVNLYVF